MRRKLALHDTTSDMIPYSNLNGDSGVVAYQFGDRSIIVRFREGGTYLYDEESAGRENIRQMKMLAAKGRGLSTFITTHVRDAYRRRLG